MNRDVVVTGLGAVGAFGVGRAALAAALRSGERCLSPVEATPGLRRRARASRSAARVRQLDLSPWIPPLVARRLSRPSRFAVVAGALARADAGLAPEAEADATTAVVLSTAFGPAAFPQAMLDQMLDEGPEAASPSLFAECVANAPAAQLAIHGKVSGTNITLSERETGALAAVSHGADLITAGRARRALVGAVEEVTPLLHSILDRFGALARDVARPLDRDRDGYVLAEGATILVLEAADDAAARGATILARYRGGGSAFDPGATAFNHGRDAERIGRSMAGTLDLAGIAVGDLGCVISGASGSRTGDALEASCLRRLAGASALPAVLTPKSVTGEYAGGFLGAAVLAACGQAFAPSPGFASPDPRLGVAPWTQGEFVPSGPVLVTGHAVGGASAWLVLEGP